MLRMLMLPTVLVASTCAVHAIHSCGTDPALLFAYFRTPETSLHLAYSCDGFNFTALNGNKAIFSSFMRDPYLNRAPDGKKFHLVATGGGPQAIHYWHTSDLVHWSGVKTIPVMQGVQGTDKVWAPEWTWVESNQSYFVFWSSETAATDAQGGGKTGDNLRTYAAWTPDFDTWSPATMVFNPGYTVIDADIVQVPKGDDGRGGVQYNLFVKDERGHNTANTIHGDVQGKVVRRASSSHVDGGYEATVGEPISPMFSEGPEVVRFVNPTGDAWILYYDCFEAGHYGLSTSSDLATWTVRQDCGGSYYHEGISFPDKARHGSFMQITPAELARLMDAFPPTIHGDVSVFV